MVQSGSHICRSDELELEAFALLCTTVVVRLLHSDGVWGLVGWCMWLTGSFGMSSRVQAAQQCQCVHAIQGGSGTHCLLYGVCLLPFLLVLQ